MSSSTNICRASKYGDARIAGHRDRTGGSGKLEVRDGKRWLEMFEGLDMGGNGKSAAKPAATVAMCCVMQLGMKD